MVAQCAYLLINKDGMGPDGKTKETHNEHPNRRNFRA